MADHQAHVEVETAAANAQATFVAPRVVLCEVADVHHKRAALREVGEVGSARVVAGDVAARGDEGCAVAPGSLPAPVLARVPVDGGGRVVARDGHRAAFHTGHLLGTEDGALHGDHCRDTDGLSEAVGGKAS